MNKNVRLIFISTLIASANFLSPILTLFFLARGLEESQIFFVMLSFSLTVFIMEVPTGMIADKYGPKASLIFGAICRGLGAALLWWANEPWAFYLSRALDGLGYTFFSGAMETLVYESLKEDGKEDELGGVFGKMQSATYFPSIFATLFGAYFAKDLQSSQLDFVAGIWAVTCLMQVVPIVFLKNPKTFKKNEKHTAYHHLNEAFSSVIKNRTLMRVFFNFTLIFIPYIIFVRFGELVLTQAGINVFYLGVIAVVLSLFSLLVSQKLGSLAKKTTYSSIFTFGGVIRSRWYIGMCSVS